MQKTHLRRALIFSRFGRLCGAAHTAGPPFRWVPLSTASAKVSPSYRSLREKNGSSSRSSRARKMASPSQWGSSSRRLLGIHSRSPSSHSFRVPVKPSAVNRHILRGPPVGDKGDDPPVSVVGEGKPGLLPGLPEQTVLRALPVLEFAADPDPLVLVQVVLLFHPVEHQVLLSPADIAQRGIDHVRPPLGRSPAWPLPGCTWG